jgi:hypothetical protein
VAEKVKKSCREGVGDVGATLTIGPRRAPISAMACVKVALSNRSSQPMRRHQFAKRFGNVPTSSPLETTHAAPTGPWMTAPVASRPALARPICDHLQPRAAQPRSDLCKSLADFTISAKSTVDFALALRFHPRDGANKAPRPRAGLRSPHGRASVRPPRDGSELSLLRLTSTMAGMAS